MSSESAAPAPPPTTLAPAPPGGRISRAIYRLLSVFHRWAESGWGGRAVATWAYLQASVVPGPTDAVIFPLALADPRRAFRLAALAVTGSVLGGLTAYVIGMGVVGGWTGGLLELAGISPAAAIESHRELFERRGWLLVLLSTLSPLSSKLVCIAAGAFGLPLWHFIPALTAGRAIRNFAIATVLRLAGPALLEKLAKRAGVPDRGASLIETQRDRGVKSREL